MPTVPISPRRIGEKPLPSSRVQPVGDVNAFGGGVGKATEQLGQQTEAWAWEYQSKIDADAIMNADNQFRAKINGSLYNENTGLMYRQGREADGSTKHFNDNWDNSYKEISSKLNPMQKKVFDQRLVDYGLSMRNHVSHHEIQQKDVALKDAANVAINNAAGVLAQPGAWQDDKLVQATWNDLDEKLLAAHGRRGKEAVQAEWQKAQRTIYGTAWETLRAADDIDGAKAYFDKYQDRMDPITRGQMTGYIKKRTEEISVNNEADTLLKANGYDLNKALEAIKANPSKAKGIVTADDILRTIKGNESNNDYEAVNTFSGAKGAIQWMDGTWKQEAKKTLGDANAPMTKDNQQKVEVAYINRLYSDLKSPELVAVAIYAGESNAKRLKEGKTTLIGDDGKEYSVDAPQAGGHPSVRQYMQKFTDSLGGPIASAEREQELEKQVRHRYAIYDQQKNVAARIESERVQNALATTNDIAARSDIIAKSGLQDHQKKILLDANQRKESDPGVRVQLEKLSYAKTLTQKDVDNLAPMLTKEHYVHYSIEAAKVGSGQIDSESKAADKKWDAWVDVQGPYTGDSNKNAQFKVEIIDRLNQEGVKGYARYDRAIELAAVENKNKGQIRMFSANNNLERQSIVSAWGEHGDKLVNLIEQGLKRTGEFQGSYHNVNVFASKIGKQITADPMAQESLDLLLRNNMIINSNTWADAYQTVTGQR